MSVATQLRTFVFADLRDYTAFVEGAGDHAAADLIRSYREIMRGRLGAYEGGEVKTEGDSFYLTFARPSQAIDFGVDVMRAAEEHDRRLRFGIGIHTGETVPLEGQFVGSAVNLAARVGAMAGEGEILITDTVRGLIRTSSSYQLVDRGEFSLKGISERVRLHAVEWRPADTPQDVGGLLGAEVPTRGSIVGRQAELAALREARAALAEGAGSVILVGAPAGMGKTRLIQEWSADPGTLTLVGACGSSDVRVPYAPLLEMLRRLMRIADEERRVQRTAPELLGLLPELAASRPRSDRDALFGAFLRLAREYARARPLAIVFDDMHWIDEASLALFHFLASQAATTPFVLVGTYRDDEIVRGHPLRALVAEIGRRPDGRLMTLTALDERGAEELLERAGDTSVSSEQRRRIVALAEGNPLFLEELARTSDDPTKALPLTVAEAILRRIAELDEQTRRLVTYAAIAGMQVDFDLLATLLHADEREVVRAARGAVDRSIFVETADGLAFRHALTREAVYRDLMRREQRLLHEEVAEALATIRGDDPAAAAEIEQQFLDAGRPERALPYAQKAGEYALGVLAPTVAIAHFERAVDAAREPLDRARALEGLGNAYRLALQVSKAVATLRDAAGLFGELGTAQDRLRVQRALARALPFGREEVEAHTTAWELARTIAPVADRVALASTLAARTYQFMDDVAAERWLVEARDLAAAAGQPALVASVERIAREVEHAPGWHRADERELAAQLDRALERDENVLLAYRRYLDARCRDATAAEREALLARARSYADEHTPGIPRAIVFRHGPPWMSWSDGNWDALDALWDELQRRFTGEDVAEIFPDTGPLAAAVALERDGPDAAGRLLLSRAEHQARTGTWRGRLAAGAHAGNLHLATGDLAAIRDGLGALIARRPPDALETPMLLLVARIVLPAGLLAVDATLVEPWLQAAPHIEGEGAALAAVAAHARATAAAIHGDAARALEEYARARDAYRELGWEHLEAELAWQRARAGDASDLAAARSFYAARGAAWRIRWLEEERWR